MSRKNIEQENKMHQCHFNWAIIKFQKVYNNIWIEKEKILDEDIIGTRRIKMLNKTVTFSTRKIRKDEISISLGNGKSAQIDQACIDIHTYLYLCYTLSNDQTQFYLILCICLLCHCKLLQDHLH